MAAAAGAGDSCYSARWAHLAFAMLAWSEAEGERGAAEISLSGGSDSSSGHSNCKQWASVDTLSAAPCD